MTDTPNLETLSDGLQSEFWRWFSAYVTREWGPSGLAYQQAVRNAAQKADAVVELQKVLHAQDAIHALMRHPAELLERARQEKRIELRMATPSRRGPGL